MNRTLVALALTCGWLVAAIAPAHASCLAPPPIEEGLETAPVVFVGTVVDFLGDERQVAVEVESVWRGDGVPSEVIVNGGFQAGGAVTSVDRFYEIGQTYLFFPREGAGEFVDDACTLTQPLTDEIAALAPVDAAAPEGGLPVETPIGGGAGGEEPVETPVSGEGVRPLTSSRGGGGSAGDSYVLPLVIGGALIGALVVATAAVRARNRPEIE